MELYLENLDEETRRYMLQEFEYDLNNGNIYISGRLTESGKKLFPDLLKNSILHGNETTLSSELKLYMVKTEMKKKRGGAGYTTADVPHNANETLAEGEFNRLYMRGLCARVINESSGQLVIYRAKDVDSPRIESQAMIGQAIDPSELIATLRSSQGAFTAIPKPNSGLSLRLIS
ncbi:hypothetical protein ABGV40_05845 [Paenibacillus amylolyticus]|uniref:hypothetical protein n=1 Tax=Paenibacillus amylolyticus TaxID=1451 RepID=UPI003241F9BD